MTSDSPAIAGATHDSSRDAFRQIVGAACVLVSLAVVFSNFILRQAEFAIRYPADWGHTLIIPLMGLYLVYLNRDALMRVRFRTTWIGLVPIVIGVGWYIFCWVGPLTMRHHNLMAAGFGLAAFGVVLLFFGWAAMRYLWFPLAYTLAFGITISDRLMNIVTYRLQDIAAWGAFLLLRMMGHTVDLNGNTITLYQGAIEHPLNVAEACSGMRMLVAFLALGVFLAVMNLDRFWQRAVLVLMAVPVAIFVNVLRVVTLGLLSLIDSDLAAGDFHSFVGLLWLVPALLIYLGIIWVLTRLVIEEGQSAPKRSRAPVVPPGDRFDRRVVAAAVVCCSTLLVAGFGFRAAVYAYNIHLEKKPIALRQPLDKIPRELGSWLKVGEDMVLDEAMEETLGTSSYLTREYRRKDEPQSQLKLHVAYFTDQIAAVPHIPERCFVAAGLTQVGMAEHVPLSIDQSRWSADTGPAHRRTGRPYEFVRATDRWTRQVFTVRAPIPVDGDAIELRVLRFQDPRLPDVRILVGYFFIANGCATAHGEKIRWLAFDKTDEYAYYTKVEFAGIGRGDDPVADFVGRVNHLLEPLLPELMRCLPDWAEVETGQTNRDAE